MSHEELEKRVRVLEDVEAIKTLHQRYISHLDRLEFQEALDLFTEDATAEVRNSGVKKGKKAIAEIYLGILARRTERHDGHLAAQPEITVEGDTARGSWLIYMFFSVPSIQWVQGRNDCEYVRQDGRWKISRLKFTRTLASRPDLYP
jgi:ketosteroid isomerase-like protein